MSRKTPIGDLAAAVMDALDEYRDLAEDTVRDAVNSVAKETTKQVEDKSPVQSGEYRKGWAAKKTLDRSGKLAVTVYNRKKPGLTHLLEKGHAKRGGGRVEGTAHIAPAEEYAVDELEKRIRKGLEG
ncbi:HK97 gp10 family phage protein [Evtepia sp.]|jgi:hypothetical protein|uniref:HK97 gp10 family phage protein n=1 Tax=Evtepia sp. TaxID=2773933 RepID=UPI0039906E59